jgi:hypothetical protein
MQTNAQRPRRWQQAGGHPVSRVRHLGFPDAAAVLMTLPGAVLWLSRTDQILQGWWPPGWPVILAGVCLAGVSIGWAVFAVWRHDRDDAEEPDLIKDDKPVVRLLDGVLLFAGGVPFVAAAVLASLRAHDARLLWLAAGWAVCMLFAMGYAFTRALLADHFRASTENVRPQLAMSCLVAILAVPTAVTFWAAWPLPAVTVCMKAKPVRRTGVLIGESKDRVYFGDSRGRYRAITSVPAANVNRVVFGDARRRAGCG